MSFRRFGALGLAALLAATALIATRAPRGAYGVEHPVNLLVYFHVSVAWVGFAGLVVATMASVAFLRRPVPRHTWTAQAAVRVSFAFLSLTLATGMVWGRYIWNSWWEWSDIRLVSALVVWFVYAGYLLYHREAQGVADQRRGAVFCVLAFISVPITVASTRLWQSTFHSPSMATESVTLHYGAFVLALVGSSGVYVYLVSLRRRLHALDDAGLPAVGRAPAPATEVVR